MKTVLHKIKIGSTLNTLLAFIILTIASLSLLLQPLVETASALSIDSLSQTQGLTDGGDEITLTGDFRREIKFTQISAGWYGVIGLGDNNSVYIWEGTL